MVEIKHTPGPWFVTPKEQQLDKRIQITAPGTDKYDYDRCEIEVVSDDIDHNTALANTALVSAAPELLAALRLHVAKSGHTQGCTQTDVFGCSKRCKTTRAAIEQATTVPEGFEVYDDDDE